jgi:DNA-directed RNA polymerase specialized sigma24 family protein
VVASHRCRPLPGVVLDGDSGYAWPSWREALADAFGGVDRAYERRRQVVQAAYDAGLTFRQIGNAVGVSAATVHRIIGKQRGKSDDLLDAPAFQREQEESE